MRDGTAERVSRDQTPRRERGEWNSFSADYGQDWQPYPVDPLSAISYYHKDIHSTYIHWMSLPLLRSSDIIDKSHAMPCVRAFCILLAKKLQPID